MSKIKGRFGLRKKKMDTFITGMINANSEVKSKTERIQLVMKAMKS